MPSLTTSQKLTPSPELATSMARVRAWSRSGVRDLAYCGAILAWSIAAFTVLVTGVALTASLLVLVIGVLVWLGFVFVLRGTTWVDRRLAGWQRGERIAAVYRRPAAPGFMARLRTVTTDPQTRRDMAWLAVTSVAGFTLGLVPLTAAGVSLAYVSMPLWYWAITDPATLYGLTGLGEVTVDTLGEALAVSAIGLVLVPLVLVLAPLRGDPGPAGGSTPVAGVTWPPAARRGRWRPARRPRWRRLGAWRRSSTARRSRLGRRRR